MKKLTTFKLSKEAKRLSNATQKIICGKLSLSQSNEILRKILVKARSGERNSQFLLGQIYSDGPRRLRDTKLAVAWYFKSANQGSYSSLYNIAQIYREGAGVRKDIKYAIKILKWLAKGGDYEAALNLGYIYANGEGTKVNRRLGTKYYTLSASGGDVRAMYNLGLMALEKSKPDPKSARAWLSKAAKRGHKLAKRKLKEIVS